MAHNDLPAAFPAVDDQEQIEAAALPMTPVPVKVVGPSVVMALPARSGPAFTQDLTSAELVHVLGRDPRRTRTTFICDVDWRYSTTKSGTGAPWYAKVPLTITHADAIYAKVPTSTGTLTVIPEYGGE
jgi:hypothetical protein